MSLEIRQEAKKRAAEVHALSHLNLRSMNDELTDCFSDSPASDAEKEFKNIHFDFAQLRCDIRDPMIPMLIAEINRFWTSRCEARSANELLQSPILSSGTRLPKNLVLDLVP